MAFHADLMARFNSVTKEVEARMKQSPLKTAGVIGFTTLGTAAVGNQLASIVQKRRAASSGRKKRVTKKRKPAGTHRRSKKAIKRGKGLGRKEIHHGHKGKVLVRIPGSKPFYAYPKGHPMSKHNKNKRKRK